MDLIASQIAQLQEQGRLQASSIDQLKSENEAQQSFITRLSSENAWLKSEVALLKRANKDQELVIGALSRAAVPGGFWVWESRREEGKEGEGRWLWSLEKYTVLSPLAVAAGPPTSLLSLPVELLDLILKLLKRKERLVLCRVSYRLLELATGDIYAAPLRLYPDEAHSFVESRVFHPAPKSERISSLLLPDELRFCGSPFIANAFQDLVDVASSLSSPPSSLLVYALGVEVPEFEDFALWMDLVRFLDPVGFQLGISGDDNEQIRTLPTARFVPANFVDAFTSDWSRLEEFSAIGPGSVLLVEGTDRAPAFEALLRRCSPDFPVLHVELWSRTSGGVEMCRTVRESRLPAFLDSWEGFEEKLEGVSLDFKMVKAKKTEEEEGSS